jgi:16S rRNA (guanine527-N7)-methyltransferase
VKVFMASLLVDLDPNADNAPVQTRRDLLVESAAGFGVALAIPGADALLAYLDGLLEANRAVNLTAVRDPVEAVRRHLADSLAFGLHVRDAGLPRRLVDLGTGGGFPGIPIAVAWPGVEVHLLDATRKKVDAVRGLVEALGIQNVRCHWLRAGQPDPAASGALPRADVVAARAVGPLDGLLRDSHDLLAPRGTLVAWKSDVPAEERKAAGRAAAALRMESLPDLEYELGAPRRLVRFRRAE